jgi:hypothetical protein
MEPGTNCPMPVRSAAEPVREPVPDRAAAQWCCDDEPSAVRVWAAPVPAPHFPDAVVRQQAHWPALQRADARHETAKTLSA